MLEMAGSYHTDLPPSSAAPLILDQVKARSRVISKMCATVEENDLRCNQKRLSSFWLLGLKLPALFEGIKIHRKEAVTLCALSETPMPDWSSWLRGTEQI